MTDGCSISIGLAPGKRENNKKNAGSTAAVATKNELLRKYVWH
jgi:hypothetical protein